MFATLAFHISESFEISPCYVTAVLFAISSTATFTSAKWRGGRKQALDLNHPPQPLYHTDNTRPLFTLIQRSSVSRIYGSYSSSLSSL